jgi:hypothetical protein
VSTVAVFAGDLVRSTRHGAQSSDMAMAVLRSAAAEVAEWVGEPVRFTRFRGDGWQMYLGFPGATLHATLLLLARLRAANLGMETRMAIGFGTVERLGSADLSDAAGEAFAAAGNALDEMARQQRVALANPTIVQDWHHAVFDLAAWIAGRWSAEQAEAFALALPPNRQPTQAEIADRLGITRQAVQLRLKGAGWDAFSSPLDAVLRHDWVVRTHA